MNKSIEKKTYIYQEIEENPEISLKKYKERHKLPVIITYLKKKSWKKTVEKEKQKTIGYVKLKKFKDKGDSILKAGEYQFDLFSKKKAFHRIKGYIKEGTGQFIAIQKSFLLPLLLIVALLLTSIGSGIYIYNHDIPVDEIIETWVPDIDDNIDNAAPLTEEEKAQTGIRIRGFSRWSVPANTTQDIAVRLENPEGNRCYFTFEIVLNETNEVLYTSKMVPPGKAITSIDISKPMAAGEHEITINIRTNEIKTGAAMNSAKLEVVMICS